VLKTTYIYYYIYIIIYITLYIYIYHFIILYIHIHIYICLIVPYPEPGLSKAPLTVVPCLAGAGTLTDPEWNDILYLTIYFIISLNIQTSTDTGSTWINKFLFTSLSETLTRFGVYVLAFWSWAPKRCRKNYRRASPLKKLAPGPPSSHHHPHP